MDGSVLGDYTGIFSVHHRNILKAMLGLKEDIRNKLCIHW